MTTESTATCGLRRRKWMFGLLALALVLTGGLIGWQLTRSGSTGSQAAVGADLHAVAENAGRVFVSGHDGAAYKEDSGGWTQVESLAGKDVMAWSFGSTDIVVAGHEGVLRSTDNGATFLPVPGVPATDIHASGAAGATIYAASPTAGLYRSDDRGKSWRLVGKAGESFMGTILVDPQQPLHILAADQLDGVVTSSDGGRTWKGRGGEGAIGLSWNPINHLELVATFIEGIGVSDDGGASWLSLPVPPGTAAVSFDSAGRVLAAVHAGLNATVYISGDRGRSWSAR